MQLELYHRWHCPYSAKVRNFIEENQLAEQIRFVELGEVAEAEDRLSDLTGKTQVPCLVVDGKPTLESSDIVAWLEQNLVKNGQQAR